MTPLHAASANGHVEAVRALVERGAAVNQAKVGYWTCVWRWTSAPTWILRARLVVGRWYARVCSGVRCVAVGRVDSTCFTLFTHGDSWLRMWSAG
jgi:hypothetical protein